MVPAEATDHLATCQLVLGMAGKPGITHRFDGRVRLQVLRDAQTVGAMPLHMRRRQTS